MRAVTAEWSSAEIRLRVYIDGKVTDVIREGFDASVVTQVVADFPWFERGDPSVASEFVEAPSPAPLSLRGVPVFLRAGERVSSRGHG